MVHSAESLFWRILLLLPLIAHCVMSNRYPNIRIVFSDLDGTLIDYSRGDTSAGANKEEGIISLPASTTGLVGTISKETLALCRKIRSRACKLALVSGMRFSTLMIRLPYLPRADAYVCDSGGRIFIAYDDISTSSSSGSDRKIVPKDPLDEPFYLKEDQEWRNRLEAVVGADGYIGYELVEVKNEDNTVANHPIPIANRQGKLWRYAKELLEQGITIDGMGYATCFRINRQNNDDTTFDTLLQNGLVGLLDPSLFSTSVNLGCIDVVPNLSGKKHCCQYLAELWIKDDSSGSTTNTSSLLQDHCICLCDDDNDIAMALACHHAFLPSVASDTMRQVVQSNPTQCTVTYGADHALELALEFIFAPEDKLNPSSSKLYYTNIP